ncbi:putative cfem domain-containing protein [Rhypophila decipiens]|uniref:Cfem domain-containing protein n=1 Tax=Rhypophila decipiens TaxID=261697 RepID=A0AAN6Y087_9PEZI|nr:putative cfem domain-containing protein [Rhypophila decipiens]
MANGGQGISPGAMLATIWFLTALATILLAGRLFIRGVIQRRFYLDDVFAILAWLSMLGVIVIATAFNELNYRFTSILVGEAPMPTSPNEFPEMVIQVRKWGVSAQTLFWTSIFCVKLSFMLLYRLVVFSLQGEGHKRLWLVSLVYIMVCYGICLIGVFGQCGDVKNLFTYEQCATPYVAELLSKLVWTSFFFNVTSDLVVVFLPLALIYHSNLRHDQKYAILGVCSLALITVVFETVRSVKLYQQDPHLTNLYGYLELLVAVIISTLPTYRFVIFYGEKSKEYRRLVWTRMTTVFNPTTRGSVGLSGGSIRSADRDGAVNRPSAYVPPDELTAAFIQAGGSMVLSESWRIVSQS